MLILALLLQATVTCRNPDALPADQAAARCDGVALSQGGKWRAAAERFEGAAKALTGSKAAGLWAQAGNAWLAAGEAARAGTALDAALTSGATLPAAERGEIQLDRARAAVAAGDLDAGRTVLDQALASAPAEPLGWLLSATLARRMGQPRRAATDIAEALKRAPEDAAVLLEAGNVAALEGKPELAKERWTEAARVQPDGDAGKAAVAALAQFGTP